MARIPERFWHVYNHVARSWYDSEYGQLDLSQRWYHRAMIFLECYADGWPVKRILDYLR